MKFDIYSLIGWIVLYPFRLCFHLSAAFVVAAWPRKNQAYFDYVIKDWTLVK